MFIAEHDALAAFLGDWQATGTSYGGDKQSPENPRGARRPGAATTPPAGIQDSSS